jgi:hypothetical protein
MQSNDDSYPHTFNNIHLSALTLYLLKSYTCLLVLRTLCPDCEPHARQSTTEPCARQLIIFMEPCAPSVGLVPASLLSL